MGKKYLLFPVLALLAYIMATSNDFTTIASGVAIFIVGMVFMEDGFRLFTGGMLEKILKKTTDTVFKSILSGFTATALIQSSSLTSVIAISFLSAELIALSQAIGIIFGANIGTTATAWIVATFGMKIKISAYAMPMIVFGVLFLFFKSRSFKGVGNILLGLGFIFLGISFMKDGFETMKNGIDLAKFAMDGYMGLAVYVLVGAIATIVIQSSSATMALIITAVATGQIEYVNSLSLAIGANIGTTVTAVLGSLTSNENGKRLAVAHFIFNGVTAIFAIVFLYVLMDLVDSLSVLVGISDEDIAMKLSLFHTIFNVAGVLLVTPFIGRLVRFLETLFIPKGERRGKPKYLDEEVVLSPGPALVALFKETEHLYDSVSYTLIRALRLNPNEIFSDTEMNKIVQRVEDGVVDVDKVYEERIKFLYSDILRYSIMAEGNMIKDERKKVYVLKLVCRDIIENVKDIREIQKNIGIYMQSKNESIKEEYNFLREKIGGAIRMAGETRKAYDAGETIEYLGSVQDEYKSLDVVAAKRLSVLLREEKIDDSMASSLMNDGTYAKKLSERILGIGMVLWEKDGVLGREVNGEENE